MNGVARQARLLKVLARPPSLTRSVHCTAPVSKKKSKLGKETLFGDDSSNIGIEDDLFSAIGLADSIPSSSTAVSSPFDVQYTFVADRLGAKPRLNFPQVRANALRRLLHHSREATHAEKVADLLPAWRESGRTVDEDTTLAFIDRCLVSRPTLLVKVLSNRPKYGVDIPNLSEARRILRAIVNQRDRKEQEDSESSTSAEVSNLRDATAFAALYPLYGLGSALHDTTSCALLALACARVLPLDAEMASPALSSLLPSLVESLDKSKILHDLPASNDNPVWTRLSKDRNEDSVLSHRMSGYTQTPMAEAKWTYTSGWGIVRALKKSGDSSFERHVEKLSVLLGTRGTTVDGMSLGS